MSTEQDLSPIDKVRSFLQGILTPAQLARLDQMLQGIDLDAGGPTASPGLQEGGSEPTPASLGRQGRDATPGFGPTDAGQGRPTGFDRRMAGDDPAAFPGRPRPGGSRDPFRQEVQMNGFAGDAMFEDRTLRAALRQRGVPIGNEGTLAQLRRACRAYGVPTGMAFDAAPHYASGDVDAALDAVARIGTMSYAGHVRSDPPRARGGGEMAFDADSSGMNSIAKHFPEVAAHWMKNEARSVFAVPVNPESVRADERSAGHRRSRGSGMAFDSHPARSRGDAASVERMFPGLNLDRIKVVR